MSQLMQIFVWFFAAAFGVDVEPVCVDRLHGSCEEVTVAPPPPPPAIEETPTFAPKPAGRGISNGF